MNSACCCVAGGTASGAGPARPPRKAFGGALRAGLPGALAILLPKCPLCLAAWIAEGTGIAVPSILVRGVRPLLLTLFAVSAALLVRRALVRLPNRVFWT